MRNPTTRFRLVAPLCVFIFACGASRGRAAGVVARFVQDPSQSVLPLEPVRRLRFSTDEATWMSVDVAPDGRTILFDVLGDLYTIPLTGGRATRITEGQAFDTQPRYSPDGRTIVFISDRSGSDNVWVADADGRNARAITEDRRTVFVSPEWTPDGQYIVVSKSTENVARPEIFHLFLYHRAGGRGVPLTGIEATETTGNDPRPRAWFGATFGSDARWLYASASDAGGYGSYQIVVLDRGTGRVYRRTYEPQSAMRPALSPDGRALVFATRRDGVSTLKYVDVESGDERWLVPIDRDLQESFATQDMVPGASFTPDGAALIVSYGGRIRRVDVSTGLASEIPFTVDVDLPMGALARFEYPINDSVVHVRRIENPRLSPDGRRLAFSSAARIWTVDLPRGTPRRLTNGTDGEFFPAWSPDGRFIAYVTWNDIEGGDIRRVAADGRTPPEQLTTVKAFWEKPAYTRDGQRIVAARGPRAQRVRFFDELLRGRPQARDLVWIPAQGGAATLITPLNYSTRWASEHYGEPHFTADSTRVHFTDPIEGLVSVRWDGTDRRSRLRVQSWEWTREPLVPADEILLSPRGDRALALVNNNVYVIDVPPQGDRLPIVSIPSLPASPVPVQRITRAGADFMGWTPDGAGIYWAIGHSLFTLPLPATREAAAAPAREPTRHDVAVTLPADRPSGSLVLRGARIITMRGAEIIERGDVVVTNNRIAAVGATGTVAVPPGARVIDVAGQTILPGWVDIHAHMWTPWGVHRQQNWEYLANLAHGVTATRDPQTMTADILTYADRVSAGEILGPRIFTTARGVFPAEDVRNQDDVRDVLRRYSEHYRTETIKNYLIGDRRERQWLIVAANEQRLTPTAEANNNFKMNLTLALDGYAGQEHSWAVAPVYRDVVQLFAQSGITYTPTAIINSGAPQPENLYYRETDVHADAKLRRFIPHEELDRRTLRRTGAQHPSQFVHREQNAQSAKIVAAGGSVGLGAHGQLQGLCVHWELWTLAAGGMPIHDVLRVGTLLGARAIGHERDFGSIEAGKLADLQILERNPLDNIRNSTSIRWVMANGRLYDANTLDEVWPRSHPLPRQWWWEASTASGR